MFDPICLYWVCFPFQNEDKPDPGRVVYNLSLLPSPLDQTWSSIKHSPKVKYYLPHWCHWLDLLRYLLYYAVHLSPCYKIKQILYINISNLWFIWECSSGTMWLAIFRFIPELSAHIVRHDNSNGKLYEHNHKQCRHDVHILFIAHFISSRFISLLNHKHDAWLKLLIP